ncbi:MAG: hypothetical protein QOJ65_1955 [Fimbriimonadaceae bacterium]|jgi:hypothetical protein|nr:hypothetical protein [Fimbriimonadaceae bacterium]
MATENAAQTPEQKSEPRWGAAIAFLAAGGLNLALGPNLSLGPRWLPILIVAAVEIIVAVALIRGNERVVSVVGHITSALLTLFLLASVVFLVRGVVQKEAHPLDLLRSAAALWLTNILVFASWYWHLDAGGPFERRRIPGHSCGAFFFPQMAMPEDIKKSSGQEDWEPGFVDYLFLAFNTSTALSPADTSALTRWAKGGMMVQALISLTVLVLLAARAVNTL